jgi:hypothetical protein
MYVKCKNEALSCNQCCSGKAICITYSECVVVDLGIQHAMRIRHISSVAYQALQYFSTLSHNIHNFLKTKAIKNNMCFFIFSKTLSKTFFILRRNERDMIKIYCCLHVEYPLFLSDFNETCTSRQILLKYQIS